MSVQDCSGRLRFESGGGSSVRCGWRPPLTGCSAVSWAVRQEPRQTWSGSLLASYGSGAAWISPTPGFDGACVRVGLTSDEVDIAVAKLMPLGSFRYACEPMDGTCPWCQKDVAFILVIGPYRLERLGLVGTASNNTPLVEGHGVYQCPRSACRRTVYVVGTIGQQGDNDFVTVEGRWPPLGSKPPHQSIPEPVAADWTEGHLCVGVGAYKAAAAMARRGAEGVCIDQGANRKKVLRDQIKDLVASGVLHSQLGDWANHVRLFGNSGAHPGDDGLEAVSQQEAEETLRFLDRLLEWTYIAPWELIQSRQQAQSAPP
jgi:hypothetical protein